MSLLSVFLLLFALGGVASADNAASISVAISYPCEQGEACDETGVAVSRSFGPSADGGPGDDVNIYITLLDASGNPADAGPNGEDFADLTATVKSQLGDVIVPNAFMQAIAQTTVRFDGDAAARAHVDYTDAVPGVDIINVDIVGGAIPLFGQAQVRVVAPDANALAVRTLDGDDAPSDIFEPVDPPNDNGENPATATDTVTVTVIPHDNGLYTPAPNLVGQQVTVKAFADFDGSGTVGDDEDGIEKTPIATGTGTFGSPVDVDLQINNAGPDGLIVVFSATAEDINGDTIETPQPDEAPVSNGNFLVDTVEMIPGDPDAIIIAEDPFENGNLIQMLEGDCITVLDDNDGDGCPGTPSDDILVVIVDANMNAVNDTLTVTGSFSIDDILNTELSGCRSIPISADYSGSCQLTDDISAAVGETIVGPLDFSATGLTGDSISVYLLPAMSCGMVDLQVSVPQDDIAAGDTVRLTIESSSGVVAEGNALEITAMQGENQQLLSSDGFASATFTLEVSAIDLDPVADGIQIDVDFFGPATNTADEEVMVTVKNKVQCDASATTVDGIPDIDPGDPTDLAVVELGSEIESESTLDAVGAFAGTDPIVIDTLILADNVAETVLLDAADSCDLQVWDAFTNVIDAEPAYECTCASELCTLGTPEPCILTVKYPQGAVASTGGSDTITCSADFNNDDTIDATEKLCSYPRN